MRFKSYLIGLIGLLIFISLFLRPFPVYSCSMGTYGCVGTCSAGYVCEQAGLNKCECNKSPTSAPAPTSGGGAQPNRRLTTGRLPLTFKRLPGWVSFIAGDISV